MRHAFAVSIAAVLGKRTEDMTKIRRINAPNVARLPAFCHATVVGQQVLVSGMLGAQPGRLELVGGGIAAQTVQALRNIEVILQECGCGLPDVAKVNVYLTDMATFAEMNDAYLSVFGDEPPARITVGCSGLALGAAVEMDCTAFLPMKGRPLRGRPLSSPGTADRPR
jgi:2-iminobutanoate/2-iminopropanoate deaminase